MEIAQLINDITTISVRISLEKGFNFPGGKKKKGKRKNTIVSELLNAFKLLLRKQIPNPYIILL